MTAACGGWTASPTRTGMTVGTAHCGGVVPPMACTTTTTVGTAVAARRHTRSRPAPPLRLRPVRTGRWGRTAWSSARTASAALRPGGWRSTRGCVAPCLVSAATCSMRRSGASRARPRRCSRPWSRVPRADRSSPTRTTSGCTPSCARVQSPFDGTGVDKESAVSNSNNNSNSNNSNNNSNSNNSGPQAPNSASSRQLSARRRRHPASIGPCAVTARRLVPPVVAAVAAAPAAAVRMERHVVAAAVDWHRRWKRQTVNKTNRIIISNLSRTSSNTNSSSNPLSLQPRPPPVSPSSSGS